MCSPSPARFVAGRGGTGTHRPLDNNTLSLTRSRAVYDASVGFVGPPVRLGGAGASVKGPRRSDALS